MQTAPSRPPPASSTPESRSLGPSSPPQPTSRTITTARATAPRIHRLRFPQSIRARATTPGSPGGTERGAAVVGEADGGVGPGEQERGDAGFFAPGEGVALGVPAAGGAGADLERARAAAADEADLVLDAVA